ncbi:hypothetical protein CDAR_7261 [Caerostris darwini]|uniref:Uncharacterized protein n=1 Tax=Caerostris darwini TaxID=1538125 RepID=A0AAV4VKD2_9ARAC|nr:hypothetical protein CDAR_7261 [Caerostris darwini]
MSKFRIGLQQQEGKEEEGDNSSECDTTWVWLSDEEEQRVFPETFQKQTMVSISYMHSWFGKEFLFFGGGLVVDLQVHFVLNPFDISNYNMHVIDLFFCIVNELTIRSLCSE